jgi:hypothetical protein
MNNPRISRLHCNAIPLGLLILTLPIDAHAYLDPGTGSMVLQVIIAGILGAVFTFKSYVRAVITSITGIFRKRRDSSDV